MQYQPVFVYDQANQLLGMGIAKIGVPKLQSVNLWANTPEDIEDFKRTLSKLNGEATLKAFWPEADDQHVAELVKDPEWEPIQNWSEEDVPDWENSLVVLDEFESIDPDESTIVYKRAMVPDATEVQQRYYKAQETVARRRAEAEANLPSSF